VSPQKTSALGQHGLELGVAIDQMGARLPELERTIKQAPLDRLKKLFEALVEAI